MKLVAIGLFALTLSFTLAGCSTFMRPTGTITIERQEFINTYAVVRVLYTRMREQAQAACERGEVDCQQLAEIDKTVKHLNASIEAKIAVPESEIDWGVVRSVLSALIGLAPI